MQFASSNAGSSNEESVRHLMAMIQNEPVLRQVLRLAQNHCLSGGLHLRFGHHSDVPPTPLFARHIEHYYVQFCRNAIVSFLAVGFAPYRIRRLRGGIQIPEVLPLGTYSWYVTRNTTPLQPTPWRSCATAPATTTTTTTTTEEEEEDRPLLRIEVASAYTSKERVHVYEFEPLNSLFACSSLLMSLLPGYLRLLHKRECVRRADHFNSHCSLVLEQVERRDMHATQNSHAIVLNMGNEARDLLRSAHAQGEGRQGRETGGAHGALVARLRLPGGEPAQAPVRSAQEPPLERRARRSTDITRVPLNSPRGGRKAREGGSDEVRHGPGGRGRDVGLGRRGGAGGLAEGRREDLSWGPRDHLRRARLSRLRLRPEGDPRRPVREGGRLREAPEGRRPSPPCGRRRRRWSSRPPAKGRSRGRRS